MHCYYTLVIIVCGVISGCTTSENDNGCHQTTKHNGYKYFEGACYFVFQDLKPWNGAQYACATYGGNLATIAKKSTLDFIKQNWPAIEIDIYWIGLQLNSSDEVDHDNQKRRRQANWRWQDETPYDYQNGVGWLDFEPGREETLVRLKTLKWAAVKATTTDLYAYICETKWQPGDAQTTGQPSAQPQYPQNTPDPETKPSIQEDSPECGNTYQYDEGSKMCYSLQTEPLMLTWDDAEDKCKDLDGQLASPSTQSKHDAVLNIISEAELEMEDVWIGLRHESGAQLSHLKQGWRWLDNSPYKFMAWGENEPNDKEKYVRMREGTWRGILQESYKYFLCQKEPNETPTPQPTTEPDQPMKSPVPTNPAVVMGPSDEPTSGRNEDTLKKGNTTDILGIVLGVAFVAILVALIIGVIFIRRRRSTQLESLVRRLKIPYLSKKSKDSTTTGADTSYSIVENTSVTPSAATPKSTVFTSEQEKPVAKFDKPLMAAAKPLPEIPINEYATVPAKKTAKPKLYATVKAYLTAPKPSIRRASSLEGLDTGSGRAYENTFISTIVRVEELNDWVKEAIASGLIEKQYKSIPTSTQSKEYCNQEHLKPKNRYRNIVPYDNNRVELSALPNDPHSHYINASYIDSYKQKKTFIAAQGPTVNTVNDFWRMIWEKSIKTVVMVSNQFEAETAKMNFVRYWPKGKEKEPFGDISVAIKKVENLPDYIVRHMSVSKGSDIKIVKQFQFKSWPDHGVPKHAMALINFREKIRKEMSKGKEPVLVHCSAGVGRTGTIIAIDYLLQQAAKEGVVDFVTCLRKLREQRTDMVQRLTQYQFIIRAVLEALTLGQTAIACSLYAQTVQTFRDPLTDGDTRMQKQFEMLVHYFTEEKSSEVAAAAELPENIKKNRDPKVLPASSKRVLLMTPVSGKNDYINAVFVDGHRRKSAYIATHAPLQHTIIDFWRAVFDYNSTVIVMLCPKYYLKTDEVYFPEGLGEKFDCTPFEIECLEEDDHNGVRRTQLSLKYCGLERHLVHFSLTEDLSGMSLDEKMATIHSIYENAKKWQQQQTEKNAPITVHCLEGTEWTGLYCILSNLFDQINEEQEVDVFHAVGQSRLARREFISTMKEYEMVYDIIALYIDQFNMYSNFL